MATDPVCGMKVDEKQAAATIIRAGQVYRFCSEACHKAFTAEPEKYIHHTPAGISRGSQAPKR